MLNRASEKFRFPAPLNHIILPGLHAVLLSPQSYLLARPLGLLCYSKTTSTALQVRYKSEDVRAFHKGNVGASLAFCECM